MPHILIVVANFYKDITGELLKGATAALENAGAHYEMVIVPGALEIPIAVRLGLETRRFDGYVALGCVIRGETTHYDTVCNESARGLMELSITHNAAIGNGIITVENESQAHVRSQISGQNKGGGAAEACLAVLKIKEKFGLVKRVEA
jgi:6,7-dimethyl-8-ribityllumazine synthase